MPYTCASFDRSAPEAIQEAIRLHLKEPHLNTHWSCLLEDLGGIPCKEGHCAYGGLKGQKVFVPEPKLRLNNPKPLKEPKPLTLAIVRPTAKRKAVKARKIKAKGRRK